jgi:hypothetical protein
VSRCTGDELFGGGGVEVGAGRNDDVFLDHRRADVVGANELTRACGAIGARSTRTSLDGKRFL